MWSCSSCLSLKGNLKTHIEIVHERYKEFKFNICQKSFGQIHHLESHISSVHDQKKDNKCKFCDDRFILKSNLKKYIAIVLEKKKDFKFDKFYTTFSQKAI